MKRKLLPINYGLAFNANRDKPKYRFLIFLRNVPSLFFPNFFKFYLLNSVVCSFSL